MRSLAATTFLGAVLLALVALNLGIVTPASAAVKVLSDAQKYQILAIFNKARSTTNVPLANLRILEWDDGIATKAQTYTDLCQVPHDSDVLQNPPLFWFYRDQLDDPVRVAHWRTLRMAPHVDLSTGLCKTTKQAKRICRFPEIYMRVLKPNIERVGCAMTWCSVGPLGAGKPGVFQACAIQSVPHEDFIQGERCSQCPPGFDYCIEGLCSRVPATGKPSVSPTLFPTKRPTTKKPSKSPTERTPYPTRRPTQYPTRKPTRRPTPFPTKRPKA